MISLLRLSSAIDTINAFIGRASAWLILVTVIISAGNAVIRKAYGISSNAWLELQAYLFAAVFLLVASYALQRGDHVRIDIVNSALPNRARHWIDVIGHGLMLMPFAAVMLYESVPFALKSFAQGETSANAGGLVLWPAKFLIFVGFFFLFLQGLSELIKCIAILRGFRPDPFQRPSETNVAEAMIVTEPRP